MASYMKCGALLCCLLLICVDPTATRSENIHHHSAVVVVGGTGDLASKYLWQALFNIYRTSFDVPLVLDSNHTFSFYAAGRAGAEVGNPALNKILTTKVVCQYDDPNFKPASICKEKKTEFVNSVGYFQTKTAEDYSSLCKTVMKSFLNPAVPTISNKEFILYLSIPPKAYVKVVQLFTSQCIDDIRDNHIKLKVLIEKPYGTDKKSAQSMAEELLKYLEEDEIYRVDHYLGKSVVKTILPFRSLNPDLESLFNKDSVHRVEIFLKETIGVEDRIDLYSDLGVLRDIHQNHLTEVLILVAMDLPFDITDSDQVARNKERLLRQIEPIRRHSSLFGQYEDYLRQVEVSGSNISAAEALQTPTFAATMVKINSPRWHDTPFLLVSGKELDKRESYVRIVFKDNFVCLSECDKFMKDRDAHKLKQIVFHIGHGDLKRPSLLVSKSLSEPRWPDGFQESIDPTLFTKRVVYRDDSDSFYTSTVVRDMAAYESVFRNALQGRRDNFISSKHLLMSWQIWDYIVDIQKDIHIYKHQDPSGELNFMIKQNQLEFVLNKPPTSEFKTDSADVGHEYIQTPSTFLGNKLITSTADHLAFLLAREIDHYAQIEIQAKGTFHIALAGGTSIKRLLHSLAQSFANLHWQAIHVWQVDERCVPHHDQRSNFQTLDRDLLWFVSIPYTNIHAMPVDVSGQICDEELNGAHAYADNIRHVVPNSQFDLVVLGLGSDGHVASLFPKSSALRVDSGTYVVTTDDGPEESQRRMSLTFPIINKAKRVAILVTGKHKSEIVSKLETARSVEEYPVLGVKPVNGTLTWYIDYEANTNTAV